MTAALESYPEHHVQLEIVEVDLPGTVLNVSEIGTFRVRVTNTGPLHLTGVTLLITALNGAFVMRNAGQFLEDDFVTFELPTIDAHGGSQLTDDDPPLAFKAPSRPQTVQDLVRVTLHNWDATLDHILIGHSDPLDTVKDNFAAAVISS